MVILGIDPGFTSMGWALLEMSGAQPLCLGASIIRTKPDNKLKRCDDNNRRCGIILNALNDIYKSSNKDSVLIAAEAQSWTTFQKADRQVAMAWGVLSAFAEFHALPIIQIRPQEIKRNLTNDKSASKGAVESVLRTHVKDAGSHFDELIKTQRNHAADALGAAYASLDHELVRTVMNIRRGEA